MKNKLLWHEIFLFGVAILLILWKLLFRNAGFDLALLWWLLGLVFGFLFIFLDRFIYVFYTHKEDSLSTRVVTSFKNKKVGEGISMLLTERSEQRELVMRSFLFVGVWMVLAFFSMTSTVNFFARGLVLGIGSHLMFDVASDFLWDKNRFDLWFWQIKRKLSDDEKKWFLGLFVLGYVFLAIGL